MKRILLFGFWVLLFVTFILGSWYVLHNDITYTSDIARDFLLLDQVSKKYFVLIGPSSSTGLFHGPLWMYLNLPAFILGRGNPVVIGWYWIFLSWAFVVSGFFIAKKLFNTATAYLYTLMIALYTVFHVRGLYNPHGAMFVLPAVFFFFVRYLQTKKVSFLIWHVVLTGALFHFQMAIGAPFAILSFVYILYQTYRWKKIVHMLSFLLLPLILGNFILFDLRHKFLLTHLALHFLTSGVRGHINIFSMLEQRFFYMTYGVEFFRSNQGYKDILACIVFLLFFIIQWKDKKYRLVYRSFLYFYVGYFFLSNLNAGGLLYFYLFPLFPLVFLPFASFVTSRYSKIFIAIFFFMYATNLWNAYTDMQLASATLFGKSQDSWLFYNNLSKRVFQGPEKSFGYFVYSPDILAYQGKYAMAYQSRNSAKTTYYFTKKDITYFIIAPPPPNNPYMQEGWWIKNLTHITSSPSATWKYLNGYKVEKFLLTKEEQHVPVEPNIDPGISFR